MLFYNTKKKKKGLQISSSMAAIWNYKTFAIIGSIKAIYLSWYLIFTVVCIWFSSQHPFPSWRQFESLLHCKVVYYFVSLIFYTFTLFIPGFLLYLPTRDLKYYLKEKSLYTNIIRILKFNWLRSFRLFVNGNNLVYSRISAFIKYVYINYTRNYENNLDRSRGESTIPILSSPKCVWFGRSLYIEMMLHGALASGVAPVWVQRIITVRDGKT